MPARRARLGLPHALAWIGWGAAAALVAQQPVPASTLGLLGAVVAGAAALGMVLPQRATPRATSMAALILTVVVVGVCAATAALQGALEPAVLAPWLAGSAAMHSRAMMRAGAADPALAPGVRPAPTLLALGAGAGLVAGAAALGVPALAVLGVVAALHVAAIVLLARPAAPVPAEPAPGAELSPPPARLLPLLALAVAGATALAALRPALSATGAEHPQPAGPAALALVVGGLAGPPLARLIAPLGMRRGGALLATIAGAAALAAPIARPGALDLVAAAALGLALAGAVALAELARRSGVAIPPRLAALLLVGGGLGAAIAGLLLTAVPVPDVVLGASIACLVAGLGAWAPGPRERVATG